MKQHGRLLVLDRMTDTRKNSPRLLAVKIFPLTGFPRINDAEQRSKLWGSTVG
jgi:hypothetical protein